jgi:hypothetical protein
MAGGCRCACNGGCRYVVAALVDAGVCAAECSCAMRVAGECGDDLQLCAMLGAGACDGW